MRALPVFPGNVIQDNNFLAASRQHKERVFDMLRAQHAVCFRGGLEADLIDDHFVNNVTSLRIKELWTACDTDARIPIAVKAIEKLRKAGFSRDKVRCYCLIGDDMERNEARLQAIYEAGAMPFAQLYRDFSETKTAYSTDWNAFARMWQRPAALIAHMENGTSYKDFHT